MDHRTAQDLLAAYALDAVDPDEALALEVHLSECSSCSGTVALLRLTAGELAGMTPAVPPASLRDRTLRAATEGHRRPLIEPAEPIEVHGIEADRLAHLLTTIRSDQWLRSAGPMFPDWTVHDLTAHLASTEALLAAQLGVTDLAPEQTSDATARAHEAVARHRELEPIEAISEFSAAASGVWQTVVSSPHLDDSTILWAGIDLPLETALTHRAFEIWTHADDIRVALGIDRVPPPPSSLVTMSRTVLEGLPFMMLVAGAEHAGRIAEVHLTGSGGGTYGVALGLDGGGVIPAPAAADVRVELDVVDFCRAIGDRIDPAALSYHTTGDTRLGADLVRSLPVLAML